ncbi:MAG: hypothetical protein KJO38_03325, partial [Gammaproteobacteria bacterium]|nr:hypothetical protein [Gammaproteobacteria bacterium]
PMFTDGIGRLKQKFEFVAGFHLVGRDDAETAEADVTHAAGPEHATQRYPEKLRVTRNAAYENTDRYAHMAAPIARKMAPGDAFVLLRHAE